MELTSLLQYVENLQQSGKIDNLQRVCGVFISLRVLLDLHKTLRVIYKMCAFLWHKWTPGTYLGWISSIVCLTFFPGQCLSVTYGHINLLILYIVLLWVFLIPPDPVFLSVKPILHLANLFAQTDKKVGTLPTCLRRIFSPANFNQSRCRIFVFASYRRANKVAKWKIGLIPLLEGRSGTWRPPDLNEVNNASLIHPLDNVWMH